MAATDNVDLKNRVRKILLECPFALLATAGQDGRPHARWMSPIFASGSLKEFHVLAAPHSRKIAQIHANPRVSWVFNTPSYSEVVTLHGSAVVEDDPLLRAQIWESMPEKQRAFILENDENLEFAIIRTQVQEVEYLKPRGGETRPVTFSP